MRLALDREGPVAQRAAEGQEPGCAVRVEGAADCLALAASCCCGCVQMPVEARESEGGCCAADAVQLLVPSIPAVSHTPCGV